MTFLRKVVRFNPEAFKAAYNNPYHTTLQVWDASTGKREANISSTLFLDAVRDFYTSRIDGPWDTRYLTGTDTVSGDPFHPLDNVFLYGYRKPEKVDKFKERCEAGEIVVNDYEVVKCLIETKTQGIVTETRRYANTQSYLNMNNSGINFGLASGYLIALRHGGKLYVPYDYPYATIDEFTYSLPEATTYLGASWSPQQCYNAIHNTHYFAQPPASLIQSALAEANSKDVDMLTAIAEMPESVQSIIDGIKTITRIVKDARNKEIKIISRAGTLQQEYAQKAYAKYSARKKRQILSSFTRKKFFRRNKGATIDDYNRELHRRLKQIESLESYSARRAARFRRDAAIEIADELSSLQLNVQYNIKPQVFLIEDLVKAIENYGNKAYASTRKRIVVPVSIDVPNSFVIKGEIHHRCFIKRRYAQDTTAGRLGSLLMTDVVVTAFEKIKLWSIIADWVFTVGDFLKSITWNVDYTQQGATYSKKLKIKQSDKVSVSLPNGQTTDILVHIEYEGYFRYKTSPSPSGIHYVNKMDLTKTLSGLSFAWQIILKRPVKDYNWN